MRRNIFACFLMVSLSMLGAVPVAAISQSVVIRTVQPYSWSVVNGSLVKNSTHELVEVQNSSNEAINMTGWSLKYLSASSSSTASPQTMRTIVAAQGAQFTILPSKGRDTFISSSYASSYNLTSDLLFSSTLAETGNVILFNSFGHEIDRVGWRTENATNTKAEGEAVLLKGDTSTLQRIGGDTDNNAVDFTVLPLSTDPGYMFGGMYDTNDVCKNIDDIQEVAPDGMAAYDDGTCSLVDRCTNIDGVQLEVPEFYDRQVNGECIEHDACANIDTVQHIVPDGFELNGENCLPSFVAKNIILTELLPNPEGADAGLEFVELYNASDETVNFADYALEFSGKTHSFPAGKLLLAHTFISFSDEDLDVTFPNTSGIEIRLVAKDGTITSTMPEYNNAPTGHSWSNINGEWTFSNQPTKGNENMPSFIDSDDAEEKVRTFAACAPNQYRSLETNRCRLLPSDAVSLTPCKEGQYRSEETNRCRSLVQTVAASLKPCNDDQFRNPSTGRCKKIASTDDFLQPCDSGWERSSETNRCRKIKATSLPAAAFPVEKIAPTAGSLSLLLTTIAVISGALAYAAWEWRKEVLAFAGAVLSRALWWRK